jgi:hypothetical protein
MSLPPGGAHHAIAIARQIARVPPPRDPAGRPFVYNGRSHPPFRAPPYRWPGGFGYRPIIVGGYLPPVFWSPDYFVVDYNYYGVDAPPSDYGWIRYGPDLLLMQLDTGQVLQDVPGAFDGGGYAAYGPDAAPAVYAPDAPAGFSPGQSMPQPDVIPTPGPAYSTEPSAEMPPAFRYAGGPVFDGDPDELPGDPPPPGGGS